MAALVELRARAIALFDGYAGEGPALCKAVLFGDRSDLSRAEDFYRDVKSVGLAHLIAVSGSHLVVVVGMVECALRALRVPRGVRSVVVGGFMAAYVVLTGMPVSAVRAAVMCSLALAAPFARRRPGGISALAVCVLAGIATPFWANSRGTIQPLETRPGSCSRASNASSRCCTTAHTS
ncbi:ComEC/Rec2 family competence protein [Gordonibacter pamelaeae]|uniref:ComEC/Rec2 family competence protein n=1 Tax=Gordonibacter pamelaeae TaxID=471189 RepID=UPI0039F57079